MSSLIHFILLASMLKAVMSPLKHMQQTERQTTLIRKDNDRIRVMPCLLVLDIPTSNHMLINSIQDKKESEYDQEIQQSHTADQPTAPLGRAT